MARHIRRTRSALRLFDPGQRYWHSAQIIALDTGEAELVTYWRNPELAGIWEFRYVMNRKCFSELLSQRLIQPDGANDDTYVLSARGHERLGKP